MSNLAYEIAGAAAWGFCAVCLTCLAFLTVAGTFILIRKLWSLGQRGF